MVWGKGGYMVGGKGCYVVVKVLKVGLYSLSSSVGWWMGVLESSNTSLSLPF